MTNTNVNTKLDELRTSAVATSYADKKLARATLKQLCHTIGEELTLDEEKTTRALNSISKSPYGQVPQLVLWLSSKYAWPVSENTQASEILELQERFLDTLNEFGTQLNPNFEPIDGDMLLDIKESKGYASFLDLETMNVVPGIEPNYDELEYLIYTFINNLGLSYCDFKMTPDRYALLEKNALTNIKAEQEANEAALARHKEMIGE